MALFGAPLQALILDEFATASASGTATFVFPAPPSGLTWTGTILCATAPTAATFLATIGVVGGGVAWATWQGNGTGGPVQAQPGQILIVTATGLVPNTGYSIGWRGSSEDSSTAVPIAPQANASTLNISGTVTVQSPPSQSILTPTTSIAASEGLAMTGAAIIVTATPPVLYGWAVKARKANTAKVYVGGSTVTVNSYALDPGEGLAIPPLSYPILYALGTVGDYLDVFAL